jgi:hypothetical protein
VRSRLSNPVILSLSKDLYLFPIIRRLEIAKGPSTPLRSAQDDMRFPLATVLFAAVGEQC